MKIAIIASGFLPVVDGVTVSGFHRLQKLSDWGHQVKLFCPDYSALASVYPNWQDYIGPILPNVEVIPLTSSAFMGLDFERNVTWRARRHLQTALEAFQPDIVHVDEPERLSVGLWQIPGIQYAQRANIPCVGFFVPILLSMPRTISTGPQEPCLSSKPVLHSYFAVSITPMAPPWLPAPSLIRKLST